MLSPAVGSAKRQKLGGRSGSGGARVIVGDHGCDAPALSDEIGGAANDTACGNDSDRGDADVRFDLGRPEPVLAGRARRRASVLGAEVRLLVDVPAPFGVLSREELARRADCRFWHEGTFEAAVRAGVQRGVIALVPDRFISVLRRLLGLQCNPANVAPRPDRRPVSDR
jgi:hypothetical protein